MRRLELHLIVTTLDIDLSAPYHRNTLDSPARKKAKFLYLSVGNLSQNQIKSKELFVRKFRNYGKIYEKVAFRSFTFHQNWKFNLSFDFWQNSTVYGNSTLEERNGVIVRFKFYVAFQLGWWIHIYLHKHRLISKNHYYVLRRPQNDLWGNNSKFKIYRK